MELLPSRLRYWRTGHGFGVHSPFAYHFITRVLREALPYYDFERIERMKVPMMHRHARLLYRLTDFFHPVTVWVGGEFAEAAKMVVSMARPSVHFVASPMLADMVVHAKPADDTAILMAKDATVLFDATPCQLKKMKETLTLGMTFISGSTGIAVCRQGLPRQDFRLHF